MNILEVCTSLSWGGMEMRVLKTAAWLKGNGHNTVILCFPGSSLFQHAQEANIETITFPFKNGIHLKLILQLRKFLKKNHFDIIHSQFSKDLRFIVPAVEGFGEKVPIVLTKRLGSYINKKDAFHKYLYSRVSLVTAISEVIKKNVIQTCPIAPKKVEVLYNGVDVDTFREAAEKRGSIRNELKVSDEIVLGMFGRFSPGKGHEEFLQAVHEIVSTNKNIRCWIVGSPSFEEDSYAREIYKLAEDLDLNDYVTFTGFRNDIPELMNAIDILVVPSHAEAFGNVAIEAMAAGKPVAASNTDGLLDIVVNGETGLQFPPQNYKILADTLLTLINDRELREKFGAAGFDRVNDKFNEEKQYRKLEKRFFELRRGTNANTGGKT